MHESRGSTGTEREAALLFPHSNSPRTQRGERVFLPVQKSYTQLKMFFVLRQIKVSPANGPGNT